MKQIARTVLLTLFTGAGFTAPAALSLSSYQALVRAQAPNFYFTFDNGSLANTVGSLTPTLTTAGSLPSQLAYDVFQNSANCFFFTLQGDAAYDPNEGNDHIISGGGIVGTNISTAVGTISLLFRTVDPGPPSGSTTGPGAKYVFTAGGSADTTNANALWLRFENPNSTNLPYSLSLAFGDSTTTILPASDVVADAWYYFALAYDETATNTDGSPNTNKATWYLGRLSGAGTLLSGKTVNVTNAIAGSGTLFFIGSNTDGKSSLTKPGDGRVDEFATWTNRQLSAAEIQAQFANLPNVQLPRVSSYQSVITGQAPTHYFQLAGNTMDSMNPSQSLAATSGTILVTNPPFNVSVGYSYDYFLDQTGAAYFSIGTDAIYTNVNLLNGGGTYTGSPGTGTGSISGMFHGFPCTNYYGGQKFIFDAGGTTGASNSFALFLENPTNANPWSLKVHFGDSSDVMVPGSNMVSDWYYFAITFNEAATNQQVHWWVGRPGSALQSGFFSATNGSLAGQGNTFYLGNQVGSTANGFRYQNSSHTGNGQISQVSIWNRVLSTNEVVAQFNALTARTSLSIAASASNVVLSWPLSTDPAFVPESSPSLSSPSWSFAGTPAISGNQYVLTNSMSPGEQFYRLSK